MRLTTAIVGAATFVLTVKAAARERDSSVAATHEAQNRREQATRSRDADRLGRVAIRIPEPPPVPAPVIADTNEAEACAASLRALGHVVRVAPLRRDNAACVVDKPVSIESFSARGARIALPDKPIFACDFAKVLGEFATQLAGPLAQSHLGAGVASIATGPGYECRGRNRVAGAKISAHGRGLAVDIAALRLSDGRILSVEKPKDHGERRFLATVRAAACGWFTTVLGPGSDAAHANHLHLDTETHGSSDRYRLCR